MSCICPVYVLYMSCICPVYVLYIYVLYVLYTCIYLHKGMHWPSAIRHLPKEHPLRGVWVKEFHHCTDLREIGSKTPPKEITLSMAMKFAKQFENGITDAEFTSVSAFYGNYSIAVATAPC